MGWQFLGGVSLFLDFILSFFKIEVAETIAGPLPGGYPIESWAGAPECLLRSDFKVILTTTLEWFQQVDLRTSP